MAKLPLGERISREDFSDVPKDFEPILERLLVQLNGFLTTVYDALNKNLTVGDNIVGQYKSIRLTAGATADDNTFTFTHTLRQKPTGVTIVALTQVASVYTPITSAFSCSWHLSDQNLIVIDAIPGLTNGEKYDLTVRVE